MTFINKHFIAHKRVFYNLVILIAICLDIKYTLFNK